MKKVISDFISFYNNKRLGEFSAQASYYIILSFFPFVMLLLSLIRLFPIPQKELLRIITALPFTKELLEITSSDLTLVTAAATLWAASKSVYSLMRGLNNLLECKETRGFIITRIFALINTILLIIIIAFVLIIVAFGMPIGTLVVTLLIMLMYQMLPNRRATLLSQFPGSCFCTGCWYIFTILFEIYARNSINYYIIYGSLSTAIFAIIWIYVCLQIFYIGAGINLLLSRHFRGNK